jgi:hypothetical protein
MLRRCVCLELPMTQQKFVKQMIETVLEQRGR